MRRFDLPVTAQPPLVQGLDRLGGGARPQETALQILAKIDEAERIAATS
jgi:hypothetical protein